MEQQTDMPTTETMPSMLLVDDDGVFRERLARAIRDRGFEVRTAGGLAEAVSAAQEDSPEMAVVDLRMPEASGLEVLQKLKTIDSTSRVVMLTGYGSISNAVEAMRLGALNYVPKPADVDDILAAFDKADKPPLTETSVDYEAPSLARVEWEHINRVLTDCGGNISEAARRLQLHRRTLQRKLQKFPPRN